MKIARYGVVILTENAVKAEGWLMTPEATDPPDATEEQMLLETVIPWAQKKMNEAILNNFRRISAEKKAANLTTTSGKDVQ
jgi:hypothetical protein